MSELKIAVLLSGGGTTLGNLLNVRERGGLMADIKLVVSSRESARGVELARNAGIRTEVIEAKNFAVSAREGEIIRDWRAMSRQLDKLLLSENFDLVCMAGFLCRYLFSPKLNGRIINIHPSLIPMFCGQGMYGHRVHEAVVNAGVKITGCTVHLADLDYDTGPIILQRCCPVFSDDSPDDVAARVFEEECRAYPDAINLIAQGSVHITNDRRAYVDGDRTIERFGDNVY